MQLFAQPLLGFFLIGGLIGGLIGILTTIFWLWMLIDCIMNTALVGTEKIIWVLVVIFTHFIGALLYYFLVRGNRGARI